MKSQGNSTAITKMKGNSLELSDTVLTAEVVFGSPGMGCRGIGICRLTLSSSELSGCSNCNRARAWIKNDGSGRLVLIFDRPSLIAKSYHQFFSGGLFLVSSPYRIPSSIKNSLQLSINTILPGVYPVLETSKFVFLNF